MGYQREEGEEGQVGRKVVGSRMEDQVGRTKVLQQTGHAITASRVIGPSRVSRLLSGVVEVLSASPGGHLAGATSAPFPCAAAQRGMATETGFCGFLGSRG